MAAPRYGTTLITAADSLYLYCGTYIIGNYTGGSYTGDGVPLPVLGQRALDYFRSNYNNNNLLLNGVPPFHYYSDNKGYFLITLKVVVGGTSHLVGNGGQVGMGRLTPSGIDGVFTESKYMNWTDAGVPAAFHTVYDNHNYMNNQMGAEGVIFNSSSSAKIQFGSGYTIPAYLNRSLEWLVHGNTATPATNLSTVHLVSPAYWGNATLVDSTRNSATLRASYSSGMGALTDGANQVRQMTYPVSLYIKTA